MLDLSRYYYSINLTLSLFQMITNVSNESNEIKRINIFIYKILCKYSELFSPNKNIILPIGFLPSNILANAYLSELDNKASSLINTTYYGRYVDDMIFITRLDSESSLMKAICSNGINEVSSFMLNMLEKNKIIKLNKDESISIVGYEGFEVQNKQIPFFLVASEQSKHLVDMTKVKATEFRFGKITPKAVIYKGPDTMDGDVYYLNVEEYLRTLNAFM